MAEQLTLVPKWLKRTQQNIWEPKIFISGIVWFGIIQLPGYLIDFLFYFYQEVTIELS